MNVEKEINGMLNNETLSAIKKSVKARLKRKNITVYFIAFEIDGGYPYFVYTFDNKTQKEAKDAYKDGYVIADAFDDYATDKNDPMGDIVITIEQRYNEWRRSKLVQQL